MHGATATVKAGKLIETGRGAGKSASGKPSAAITLARPDVSHYEVSFPDRASFAAVRTKVHDTKSGKKIDLVIPNPDAPPGALAVHTERHAFGSAEAAKSAALVRLQKLNHRTAKSSLTVTGRADISAEKTLTLTGSKKDVDGDDLVETVTHTYEGRSWETKIDLNAGNKGKAKVGRGKKKAKSVNLVVPTPPR
jgi:phage protein D